jgi:hypothetical protein
MSIITQNIVVAILVLACAAFVLWQGIRTLRGRGGKVGSCCAQGCEQNVKTKSTVFMPAENLKVRR